MATRDKHRKRSHVNYHENKRNAQHWMMTRPYNMPVGLKSFISLINGIKEEGEETKNEVYNS